MSKIMGWKYQPLILGCYGYDNHVTSIATMFSRYSKDKSLEDMASDVHDGWTLNYTWRRDHADQYRNKPAFKPLGDPERNLLASTPYCHLSEEQKEKDRIVVRGVYTELEAYLSTQNQ
jgi:hypothetical protein